MHWLYVLLGFMLGLIAAFPLWTFCAGSAQREAEDALYRLVRAVERCVPGTLMAGDVSRAMRAAKLALGIR